MQEHMVKAVRFSVKECYHVLMMPFKLDPILQADTYFIGDIGLCRLLLMNDARFPWLILAPRRAEIYEIHELTPLDQTILTFEMTQISTLLKDVTCCTKINVGALGNIVRQLHIHIIARHEDDTAWPGPVWGQGQSIPYTEEDAKIFINQLTAKLSKAE